MPTKWFVILVLTMCATPCPARQCSAAAKADSPDYAASIALRSSAGFVAALEQANAQLASSPADCDAPGVRALAYANGVDFMGMSGGEARTAKFEALALARRLAPARPWTRAAFGLIHMFDDPAAAADELNACIRETPGFLECYNLLGDLFRKSRRHAAAERIYRTGLSRWPNDGELLVSHALLLEAEGQPKKGIETLERLVAEQPAFPRGHWHLAVMIYDSGGDRNLVRMEAERALSLDPLIWHGREWMRILDGTAVME